MEDKDRKGGAGPVITIVERRKQGQRELSSAELMRIVRKRSAKGGRRETESGPERQDKREDLPLFEIDLSEK